MKFNPLMSSLLTLLTFSFVACGGGGGGDNSASGNGQLRGDCSLKVFGGATCPVAVGPVVALEGLDQSGDPLYFCSGVFLTPQYILTAAHCANFPGAHLVAVLDDAKIKVSHATVHPKYMAEARNYDVSVLMLEKPVSAATLPLLESEATTRGQSASLFGFGDDQNGDNFITSGSSSETPKVAHVEVGAILDGVILFGSNKDGVCSGDSGGPAVRVSSQGISGIIGIASGGPEVCGPATLTISELESSLGRPLTQQERDEIAQFSVDGEVPANAYTDIQSREVTDFIVGNVPGVELR